MKTVSEVLDLYFEEHVQHKAVAWERVKYAMQALKEQLGSRPIQRIDIPLCRIYASRRSDRGSSNATARRELGVLKAAANHCVKWRHITPAELPSIELPSCPPSKLAWLYKDELQAFMAVTEGHFKWFMLLAYYTGARKRSIETLKWNQVDLDNWRIDLAKEGEIITAKRRPIVPIAAEIRERFIAHYEERENEYVLGSSKNIRPMFDKYAKLAGIEVLPARGMRPECRVTPHMLRHSRATHLLQAGKDPYAVANLLGDNLQTVLRVYGHMCPDYLEGALDD